MLAIDSLCERNAMIPPAAKFWFLENPRVTVLEQSIFTLLDSLLVIARVSDSKIAQAWSYGG